MISISTGLFCKTHCHRSPFLSSSTASRRRPSRPATRFGTCRSVDGTRRPVVRGCSGDDPGESEAERTTKAAAESRSFLTLEEAGLVEISGLSTHERFLCRLTISSLNLLRVVAEQEGCSIEELNAGRVCDWFLKDKLKREQNPESAVLQWDDSEFQL
ncbi:uncharacterized protein LOC115756916 [Rhodamnia argentea]|uniref:Uncharacterized protein LOC115756916 n=1 Tax=Rhodamnia argentea TaxID=178133 RepID=A0A8B8R2R1_9MYRT|nr:uncharacterized protein LOC115756916 [Rhodamnia argentea]XP_030552757.2 uncharacterized protein LOC115756916 [Rhodamnia argentea]